MSENRKTQTQQQSRFFRQRLGKINKVIGKLEGEVEKAVERFMKQGEKSSRVLRKNFDDILGRIGASDIYSKATEKTEELTREARRLADEIVAKVKNFDLKKANTVLAEIRANIDEIVEKIQSNGFVEIAKDKAINTGKQVLTLLKIPSQDEVNQLSRKVTSLEKKIKTLTKQAA